jgi:O-antigen ligase
VGGVIGIGLVSAWAIGSWIGLAAAALLMAGLSAAGAVRPRVLAILCLTFVLVIALGGAIGFKKIHRSMNSINVRTVSARIGLAAVAERPVFGFGAGGFAREYRRLERDVFGEHLTRRRFTVDRLSAHNAYLDIAVERGMFGLAAFVGIVAALLALGVRAALRIKDVERRALLIALVAGLTGFAVDSFTDNLFSFSKVSAIFWILGAALVRLAAEPSANAETPPSSP